MTPEGSNQPEKEQKKRELELESLATQFSMRSPIPTELGAWLERAEKLARPLAQFVRTRPGAAALPESDRAWLDARAKDLREQARTAERAKGTPPLARIQVEAFYEYGPGSTIRAALFGLYAADRRPLLLYDNQMDVLPLGHAAGLVLTNSKSSAAITHTVDPIFGPIAARYVLASILTGDPPAEQTYPPHRGYGDYVLKRAITSLRGEHYSLARSQRIFDVNRLRNADPITATHYRVRTSDGQYVVCIQYREDGRITDAFS